MEEEIKRLTNMAYEEDYWKDIVKDNGKTVLFVK
jgi:hypothetical protein